MLQSALTSILQAQGFKVYDYPPDKTASYPFIIIGNDNQSDLDVKTTDYIEIDSTILVFSLEKRNKEVKEILESIRNACLKLKSAGEFEIVGSRVTESFTAQDNENQLNQGVITIKFKMIKGG